MQCSMFGIITAISSSIRFFKFFFTVKQISREMTKPTMWLCTKQRLRSAWAFAHFDQSLRCPHEETLGP